MLTYHVIGSEVTSADAQNIAEDPPRTAMALGGSLDLAHDGTTLEIDGVDVIDADIMASNGIIHEIEAVLLPNIIDVVTTDAQLTSLSLALDTSTLPLYSILSGTGTHNVFAPVNSGFDDLLTAHSVASLGDFSTAVGMRRTRVSSPRSLPRRDRRTRR